jgi:hypothetical protein
VVVADGELQPCVKSEQRAGDQGNTVKLATSQELYAYWNLLRGARSAPERSEIDPGAIRGVLADTFILEVDVAQRFAMRIAGTRTNSLFARELKGSSFIDLWQAPDQREIVRMLASVAEEATAMVAGVSSNPRSVQPLDLELILLPLRHHGKTQARILGALSPFSLPSWIGLFPAGAMSLLSLRVLGHADCAPGTTSAAQASAEGFGRPPAPDRRGHLFVHQGAAAPR